MGITANACSAAGPRGSVAPVLYDPRTHEPLRDARWSRAAAEAEIRAIARDADEALRHGAWWPLHPSDDDGETPDALHGVYIGAAGVLWALDQLARAGLHEPGHDYARLALDALEDYGRRPEFGGPLPSLWLGEGGIGLVAWLLAPSEALADRLAALVAVPEDDTLELLWGSPGLLAIADAMLARTGEPRWSAAWSALAEHLLALWGERAPHLWTQRLYGKEEEILGAGHGLAGVVAMLARRPELLPHDRLLPGALAAVSATALREDGLANWPPTRQEGLVHRTGTIRTQWCHGAPGIVTSLAALPAGTELDELLLEGGALTWEAGPLRKGAGLCHGTAGNGFALLKLFARTGDEVWLERARRFAMHAAAQVEAERERHGRGRHTLWTGDLGTAVFLCRCLDGGSELPAIERW
jgi:lanthionine synthetase-like protein